MKNRWVLAVAGTVVMICLGTVYSWSLFTQPLIASFGWSNRTTTLTFSLAILFLGIGSVIGGRWQDRSGPRPVVVTGAALWGIGNILAGLGTAQFGAWWIYLTYGVIGGLGLGLGYITPVAVVTKWFPDKRGLGSGMVVMGFGLGAFFYSLLLKSMPAFATVLNNAKKAGQTLSGHDTSVLMMTFIISGVVYLVVGGLCATYLTNPPAAEAGASARKSSAPQQREFSPLDAARTWQFYALWLMLFLNVTAGILFISNAVPIMQELTGISSATAASIYAFLALFNGLGRFFWGAVSDRIGRRGAYILIYATQVVIFLFVGQIHSLPVVATLFAIVLLDYGGGFGTMPSFTADYFGTRFMGAIYGWILLAWGVGGVVGPIFVAYVKDYFGVFRDALPWIAGLLLIAMVLPVIIRRPRPVEVRGFALDEPART